MVTAERQHLTGNFSGHLKQLLLIVLDECFWSGDKAAEGVLKNLITGQEHNINEKFVQGYKVRNLTRVAIIGNDEWLVPASDDERRYAVFSVGEGRKCDRKFFKEMQEGMEADNGAGYRLLLRYLLDFDLSAVDVNAAPNTAALLDQKHQSLDPFQQWWFDCLQEGRLLGGEFEEEWPDRVAVPKEKLRQMFARYLRERNVRAWVPTAEQIGRMLKACSGITGRRARQGQALLHAYPFPSLYECRLAWELFIGGPVAWNDSDDPQD